MVFDAPHLGLFRQQVVEMTPPATRVFACPDAARPRPIENTLDAAAKPARGLGLCRPYRLQSLHDERDVDVLRREGSEDGIDIGFQRCRPLRRMLWVPPPGVVRSDVGLGALPEGHGLCGCELFLLAFGPAGLDRIDSVEPHVAARPRLLARLGEAN